VPDDALPDQSTTALNDVPGEAQPAPREPARTSRIPAPAPAPVARVRPLEAGTSPSITARLQELEARLAVAPPPMPPLDLPVRRPTKSAGGPTKRAPASRTAATKAPVPVAAETPLAAEPLPALEAVPVVVPAVEVVPATPSPARPGQPTRSRALGAASVLVVLLLAVAAGLGTAALVLKRTPTFEARTVVQLVPVGTASQDVLRAAVATYEQQLAGRDLTGDASASVGVRRNELRGTVRVQTAGPDKIRLIVRARSAGDAEAVARAAGTALVELVVVDQIKTAATPEDTLSATAVGGSVADRVKPSNTEAGIAAGLAAVVVLVLAGLGAGVRRARARTGAGKKFEL
jgi:hypothetical protein